MNYELGGYPDIDDPEFYRLISNKKEFYDNRISNKKKDVYCLEPQQRFLKNYINPLTQYNSLLIYHSVGVGKTLTAISIAENFKENYNILVLTKNKSIELNFIKEIMGNCTNYISNEERQILNNSSKEDKETFLSGINKKINKHYKFISYGSLVNKVLGEKTKNILNNKIVRNVKHSKIKNINNTVLIIDEVHNITNNDTYIAVKKLVDASTNYKILLLSATPMYDNITQIFEISNLLGNNLPIRNDLSKNLFIKDVSFNNTKISHITKKGLDTLLNSLKGKVSYLTTDTTFYPVKNYIGTPISNMKGSINIFRCPMSKFQELKYTEINNTNDILYTNSSNAATIVYPDNTIGIKGYSNNITNTRNKDFLKFENIKKYSSKLHAMLNNLKHATGPCFIFSSLVNNGGTNLIKQVLKENNYSQYGTNNNKPKFLFINDTIDYKKIQQLIFTFNKKTNIHGNNIKILIGSLIVSEGLTFKNINQIHVLEPHWNLSLIDQVIGRGVRFRSHMSLPEEDRYTNIFLYAATSNNIDTIDILKYKIAELKDVSIKKIENNIKKIAIDCYNNKSRNLLKNTLDYTRQCNYTKCNYSCKWEGDIQLDVSTYNILKHDYQMYQYILNNIIQLYTIGHVYSINYILNYIKKNEYNISNENIYYVLNDIVEKKSIINNPLNIKCNIINIDDIYIANPIDNINVEQMFNKIYNKKYQFPVIETTSSFKNKKQHKKIKTIEYLLDKGVYGSYSNKLGIIDNIFRIYDNRYDSNKIGKVCSSYSKEDLIDISIFLNIYNKNNKNTKSKLCNNIENFIKKNKKIIK